MKKTPNLFLRDRETGLITKEVDPQCQWAIDGEGVVTEKLDGTNVRLTVRTGTIVRIEKRRNPKKDEKTVGIVNPWYVDVSDEDPSDKHVRLAAQNTDVSTWGDDSYVCEAIGPKIQSNPLCLEEPVCIRLFNNPQILIQEPIERDPDNLAKKVCCLWSVLNDSCSPEGIVFHHPDGRRAKLKIVDIRRSWGI